MKFSVFEVQKLSESSINCYKLEISKLKRKLEDKENDHCAIIFKYENKLKEMEAKQTSTNIETQKIRDRAALDVILHKKACILKFTN